MEQRIDYNNTGYGHTDMGGMQNSQEVYQEAPHSYQNSPQYQSPQITPQGDNQTTQHYPPQYAQGQEQQNFDQGSYVPQYHDYQQAHPQNVYNPSNEELRDYDNESHTIDYNHVRNGNAGYTNNQDVSIKQMLTKKLKLNNENFVILALIASVVLTSVIIGIGWSLFSPKAQDTIIETKDTVAVSSKNTTSAGEAQVSSNPEDLIIVYGANSSENNIGPNTIDTAKTTKVETPITSVKSSSVKAKPVVKKTIAATKTTPTTSVKKKPSNVLSGKTLYWIQVFSTTNKDRAVQIKDTFEKQGLTPNIGTKTIGSKVYYRLRIGPYVNKAESNKFLEWIKNNPDYKDAYISSSK